MKHLTAIVIIAAAPALVGAAVAPESTAWSDLIPVAETSVAVPPALVSVDDVFHLFWLDRRDGQIVLLHTVRDSEGKTRIATQQLARGADSRFGWPVAAKTGKRIVVVWMSRACPAGPEPGRGDPCRGAPDVVQLMSAALDTAGTLVSPPRPIAPAAEESGRIAIQPDGEGLTVAWSQFDHGQRRVWYLRITPDGAVDLPARAVASGDGPSLVSGTPIRLVWWHPVGFDTYRLMVGSLRRGVRDAVRPLTGTIALARIVPPIGVPGPKALDVLIPVTERAFGTAGRVYHVRLAGEVASPRQPLLGSRSIADVTGASTAGQTLVVWSQATGRRRNSEIFTAVFDGQSMRLLPESRITYSPAGSIRPTITAAGSGWLVAWLEVTGVTRFQVSLATTLHPRQVRFLFGIPELDLYRPWRLLSFSGTVVMSTLPYAALYTLAFALPALGLAILVTAIFGGFTWWQTLQRWEMLRLTLFLLLALTLQVGGRTLIPGLPTLGMMLAAMAVPLVVVLPVTARGVLRQGVGFWATAGAILLVQFLMVLYPWAATQLSQY